MCSHVFPRIRTVSFAKLIKAATARCKNGPQKRSDGILCLAVFVDLITADRVVLTEERERQRESVNIAMQ